MKKAGALVFRITPIHPQAHATKLRKGEYFELIDKIAPRLENFIRHGYPREIPVGAPLRANAAANVVLADFAHPQPAFRDLDGFAAGIFNGLTQKSLQSPRLVIVVCNSAREITTSYLFSQMLVPFLRRSGIALVVVDRKSGATETVVSGSVRLGSTSVISAITEEPAILPSLATTEALTERLRPLFGHFAVEGLVDAHFTGIVSVRDLADDADFITRVLTDASTFTGGAYDVIPVFIPGSGLDDLARRIFSGAAILRRDENEISPAKQRAGIVFVDILGGPSLEDLITRIRAAYRSVTILAVASYENASAPQGVSVKTYARLPFHRLSAQACVLCEYGATLATGTTIPDLERQVHEFDPATFWELVATSNTYYDVKHFASRLTLNHYFFRVHGDDLFRTHAYGFARRIANTMRRTGILQPWIERIVCVASEDGELIARQLARVLHIPDEHVVSVERAHIREITGRHLPPELARGPLSSTLARLRRSNVVVIDQAAHHLATLSNLRALCAHADATVLACSVVMSRIDPASVLEDHFHGAHWLPLYVWHCPAWKVIDCPCKVDFAA